MLHGSRILFPFIYARLGKNTKKKVRESVEAWGGGGEWASSMHCRRYHVTVKLHPPKLVKKAFGVKWKQLAGVRRGGGTHRKKDKCPSLLRLENSA